ncbi:MAG: OmpA family protein [Chitinophagales bacterium]|nr:OmpA family protein [Chitinophagales bacterium]
MNKNPKILLIVLLTFFFFAESFAQRGVKLGDKYVQKFDFLSAINEYQSAYDKDANNVEAVKGLASCYRHLGMFTESEIWYSKLVELQPEEVKNRFYYSQALMSTKKYNKALASWEAYMSATNEAYVSNIIDGFEYLDKLSIPDPSVEIKNAENLNTPASDFGASFMTFVELTFCSTRPESKGLADNWTHEKYTDIYYSKVSFENQSVPTKFKNDQYNGVFHDGPVMFYERSMYLTRSQYKRHRLSKSKEDKTVNLEMLQVNLDVRSPKLKLYAQGFDFNNKEYSVAHPSISADGNMLIFSSDSKVFDKSYGGTDLFMIVKENGVWSQPRNLGPMINTPADEEYPFFTSQNEIFFASDGHYGLGGLDIYSSRLEGNNWSKPRNLGAPINTSFDDFNYVYNEESQLGFLSSNRPGGKGSDDIYTFRYTDNKNFNSLRVNVLVYNEKTLEALEESQVELSKCSDGIYYTNDRGNARLSIDPFSTCSLNVSLDGYIPKAKVFSVFDQDVNIEIPLRKVTDNACELKVCVLDKNTKSAIPGVTVKIISKVEGSTYVAATDKDGCAKFLGILPDNSYDIIASKEVMGQKQMYLAVTDQVITNGVDCPSLLSKDLYLEYVQLGVPYVIENIYYDLDKYFIRPDAAVELNKIVELMKNNPTIEIELGSHTDCRQTAAYNQNLSNNRAKAAVEYIVSKGIKASRLTWKGYGETQLVNSCACECEKAVGEIGLRAFRDCEDSQVQNCSDSQHQSNRRTEFKITKF